MTPETSMVSGISKLLLQPNYNQGTAQVAHKL